MWGPLEAIFDEVFIFVIVLMDDMALGPFLYSLNILSLLN